MSTMIERLRAYIRAAAVAAMAAMAAMARWRVTKQVNLDEYFNFSILPYQNISSNSPGTPYRPYPYCDCACHVDNDCKFTYSFTAHMHEIPKYVD